MTTTNETIANEKPLKPLYIRMPRSGVKCPYTSLSRSTLWNLHCAGRIVTVPLTMGTKPNSKGCRLVLLSSVEAYLHSLAEVGSVRPA